MAGGAQVGRSGCRTAGSIAFDGYAEWGAFQVAHDPGKGLALASAAAAIAGVMLSLGIRRRRVWVRVSPAGERTVVEAGGLARTEGRGFADEFAELCRNLGQPSDDVAKSGGERRMRGRQGPRPAEQQPLLRDRSLRSRVGAVRSRAGVRRSGRGRPYRPRRSAAGGRSWQAVGGNARRWRPRTSRQSMGRRSAGPQCRRPDRSRILCSSRQRRRAASPRTGCRGETCTSSRRSRRCSSLVSSSSC